MKRYLIAALALACAPLSGCGLAPLLTGAPASLPASPAAVANHTTADESAARAAQTAFDAWELALNVALDAGVHGPAAAQLLDYDKKVRAAFDAAKDAYHAFNATSYGAAISDMRDAITAGSAIIKAK